MKKILENYGISYGFYCTALGSGFLHGITQYLLYLGKQKVIRISATVRSEHGFLTIFEPLLHGQIIDFSVFSDSCLKTH